MKIQMDRRALKQLANTWNFLGRKDPFWAVLTHPEKKGGKWDVKHFFKTGEIKLAGVFAKLEEMKIEYNNERVLDFGCGVGRLSQALGDYFKLIDGVDIASPMIDQASTLNRLGNRCAYHLISGEDLSLFSDDTFDFICSFLVLQHIPPSLSQIYLKEFFRILKQGGILVFQLPEENLSGDIRSRLDYFPGFMRKMIKTAYRYLYPEMDMYCIAKVEVEKMVRKLGGELIAMQNDLSAGPLWPGYTYYVKRI